MQESYFDTQETFEKLNEKREARLKEEATNVKEVIKSLIDQKASNDNAEEGKTVQLLRGLAFSDDPLSDEFMKRLTKLINMDNFGDLTK